MNWVALINAVVNQLPTMIELGVNVASLIPEIKKGIEAVLGRQEITAADADSLRARVAEAEAAWQAQVTQAQSELDAEKNKG